MKGRQIISVTSRKASYHLELERKISVLKGNSGTGKSSLIRLISEHLEYGKQSGVKLTVNTNASLAVLTNTSDWVAILSSVHNSILFIDEDVRYLYNESFQRQLWKADCYAVIVSRSGRFTALPYSISGIYEFVTERRDTGTVTTMHRLYEEKREPGGFELILTEDSNSGYEMTRYTFEPEQTEVASAGGSSSVLFSLQKQSQMFDRICVIVDGAAFGAYIEPVLKLAGVRRNVNVSAPESFEYTLLNFNEIKKYLSPDAGELTRTFDYCDSADDSSWEQYYEELLKRITAEHFGFTYSKRKLNPWFMNRNCAKQFTDRVIQCFVSRRTPGDE